MAGDPGSRCHASNYERATFTVTKTVTVSQPLQVLCAKVSPPCRSQATLTLHMHGAACC